MEERKPTEEEMNWLVPMMCNCIRWGMDKDEAALYLSRSYNICPKWTDHVWPTIPQENQDATRANSEGLTSLKSDRRRPQVQEITWLRPMLSNCVGWGMDKDESALYLARTYNIHPNWTDEVWQMMMLPESPEQPSPPVQPQPQAQNDDKSRQKNRSNHPIPIPIPIPPPPYVVGWQQPPHVVHPHNNIISYPPPIFMGSGYGYGYGYDYGYGGYGYHQPQHYPPPSAVTIQNYYPPHPYPYPYPYPPYY